MGRGCALSGLQKSLTRGFQGASFSPFQPAAGVELSLGRGIDVKCNNKDAGPLGETLQKLLQNGAPRAEIDAFKLWLAFIDHGDTKTDNHKFACLNSKKNGDTTNVRAGSGGLLCWRYGIDFWPLQCQRKEGEARSVA